MLKRLQAELFDDRQTEARQRPQLELAGDDSTPHFSPAHARLLDVQLSLGEAPLPVLQTYPGAMRALIWVSGAVICWAGVLSAARAIL